MTAEAQNHAARVQTQQESDIIDISSDTEISHDSNKENKAPPSNQLAQSPKPEGNKGLRGPGVNGKVGCTIVAEMLIFSPCLSQGKAVDTSSDDLDASYDKIDEYGHLLAPDSDPPAYKNSDSPERVSNSAAEVDHATPLTPFLLVAFNDVRIFTILSYPPLTALYLD